jgi:hypothetical protein
MSLKWELSIIKKHRKQAGLFYITIVDTDIALTANMGAIVEIYCSRIVFHHNFTHSAMEAQSVYIQLRDLVNGNNRVEMFFVYC